MPGTLATYDPDNRKINELFDKEREERIQKIDTFWKWRDGEHPDTLIVHPGERSDNVKLNLTGQMTDDMVDFIGIPTVEASGGVDNVNVNGTLVTETSPAQMAVEQILAASDFDTLANDTQEAGLVAGHVFLRIVPQEDGPPMLALLDPRMVQVAWNIEMAGLRKSALFYRITWEVAETIKQQDIVPSRLIGEGQLGEIAAPADTWVIIERVRQKRQSNWTVVGVDVWEWPFAPIVDGKVMRKPHAYYGKSFLADYQLNDAINFVASNTAKIIKHHAHPKTIVKNAQISEANAVDEMIEITSRPGTDGAEVFNLAIDPNGVRHSLDYLSTLRSTYFSTKRVIDPMTVRDKIGQMTNFGLRTLYKSMIDNVQAVRWMYDAVWTEAFNRCLTMMGYADTTVTLTWEDPLPMDRREIVETVEKEKALGFTSDQTLAKDLERDYMKERQQLEEEGNLQQLSMFSLFERAGQRGLMT